MTSVDKGYKRTVLVVDDTPQNLVVMGEILMPHYIVRIANSGQRALELAELEPQPELILLDVMMPDVDGYEVIKNLIRNPATRDIPVIFVTAMDSQDDETYGLALGAVDYITKPVCPAIVLARVRTHLQIKDARDFLRDKNIWLQEEVDRRMYLNQQIQDVSMRALACLAETRDNETGNHILRTKEYVYVLARELAKNSRYASQLNPRTIEIYRNAAPLHDIGKVGIPDHVLHKPDKLDAEEWEVMKTHAQLGADAIANALDNVEKVDGMEFMYVAMDIAAYHHEKWDGSGYPKGLKGEDIPLSARLMALADVFDALISKRVYKPAFSLEKSTNIILEGRGTHFDPDIVDVFIKNKAEFNNIAMLYQD